jgi:hypothetical protein
VTGAGSITIYVFPVTDLDDMNRQYVIVDRVYDTIVPLAHPVPVLP